MTPDGRYFVVRGRLWRCSDQALDADRRARLVAALMRARRGLRGVQGAAAKARAHAAVERAKRALGERGGVWWTDGAPDYNRHLVKNTPYGPWYAGLPPRAPVSAPDIVRTILEMLAERAPSASACPSDIARRLAPGTTSAWRDLMPRVREAVGLLSRRGRVLATRGPRQLKPTELGGGPIRIRRGPRF